MTTPPAELRRPNRLLVSLQAIADNVGVLRRAIGGHRTLVGVLKAEAYGFGVVPVGRRMAEAGVDVLALADLDAAVALRDAGVRTPILLYAGALWTKEVSAAIRAYDITPTVAAPADVAALAAGTSGNESVRAYVKLDVGLERIGLRPEQTARLAGSLRAAPAVHVEGAYAHLHVPRAPRSHVLEYVRWQIGRFRDATSSLESEGVRLPRRIAASSGVLWLTPEALFDGIDPGRLLYGITGPADASERFAVRPALVAILSALVAVKDVDRSAFGEWSPLPEGVTRFGVLPIGLVDGMPYLAGSHVLIGGVPAPVIGPPSLEYTRVDLSAHAAVRPGAEVVLVGTQEGVTIGADEVLARHDPDWMNGLALRAGPRVERRYVD